MELIVVRHGLPAAGEGERPADPPLAERGRVQADRVGAWLAAETIDAIYSSPLARARQTAAPLARLKALAVQVLDGLAEFEIRRDRYTPLEQLRRENYARWRRMMDRGWFSDQDPKAYQDTVAQAFETIIAAHPGARVAVFCHAGVINVWATRVLGMDRYLFFTPGYTSIHRFAAGRDGARGVLSLNEQAHLRESK